MISAGILAISMVGAVVDSHPVFMETEEGAEIMAMACTNCTSPVLAKLLSASTILIAHILSALPIEDSYRLIQEMKAAALAQTTRSPNISEVSIKEINPKVTKKTYFDGLRESLHLYAWWKDGVQYVGTTGTTLKGALGNVAIKEKRFYDLQTELQKEKLEQIVGHTD